MSLRGVQHLGESQPQQDVNPTSASVPGEVTQDRVTLIVQPDAAAGRHRLETGLYDPAVGDARLAALNSHGNPLPDGITILIMLTAAP